MSADGTYQGDVNAPITTKLTGIGVIGGNVVNAGTVIPGDAPGTLTINGNYRQTQTGTLPLNIASATNYSQWNIKGKAVLGGTLQLTLLNGYVPAAGTPFNFTQAQGGISGRFSTINAPAAFPVNFQFTPNGLEVLFGTPLPFTTFARDPNEFQIASALDSVRFTAGGDLGSVIQILNFLPEDQLHALLL